MSILAIVVSVISLVISMMTFYQIIKNERKVNRSLDELEDILKNAEDYINTKYKKPTNT